MANTGTSSRIFGSIKYITPRNGNGQVCGYGGGLLCGMIGNNGRTAAT
jgi:hypothetical protein